jgi:hypothetical protein
MHFLIIFLLRKGTLLDHKTIFLLFNTTEFYLSLQKVDKVTVNQIAVTNNQIVLTQFPKTGKKNKRHCLNAF